MLLNRAKKILGKISVILIAFIVLVGCSTTPKDKVSADSSGTTFLLTENGVWVPENAPHPKSPEGLLDKASSCLVEGHYEEAIRLTS